ncbi:VOC family protein [Nocardioides sp. NPDC006303]|uniref:2-oxoadipate dioxygenase/decarboxylase HglS n=1 Tax=Nocardioides sp. NPDC006303 TaxID=3156747 RepID=UPI0033A1C7ED
MTIPGFTSEHEIRTAFFMAMSKMYRTEVPLYGDLLDIVDGVNARVLSADAEMEADLRRRGEYERLGQERHGAIRVGTGEELATLRRMFAVMGMHPVGYYDLSVAGVPVHSTAFRPVDLAGLNRNPFRVFTSLLRLELIDDAELRNEASRLLSQRRIFTDRTLELTEQYERDGGLEEDAAAEFVTEVLETFRWHGDTVVDAGTYKKLNDVHRLVADVACFRGPHINHLTPRTLDIDAVQAEMLARGIDAKDVIEGPPRREHPILLRQTSFKALEERIKFHGGDDGVMGTHAARFGEIEQRGLALTPKGRALYEELLAEARGTKGAQARDFEEHLEAVFSRFPDDLTVLRREELGYFNYRLVVDEVPRGADLSDLESLIAQGVVEASPIIYEDFLPVSAAGIFQSNLGGTEQKSYSASEAKASLEHALGAAVAEPFELYAGVQEDSLERLETQLVRTRSTG